MKRCPKCNREFDDELRFCLEDGTALVGDEIPPTVAAPTMVLPTSPETPPTMTQPARADVPSLPNLAATRMDIDDPSNINNAGASRSVIMIGVFLGVGLLIILVALATSNLFYFRHAPMILLCLFGMVLAMIRAKRHSMASLMVGLSLGFYLLETFVISIVYYSMPRIASTLSMPYWNFYMTVTVIDSFAFAAVIVLLVAAVFAGRSPRSKVYN